MYGAIADALRADPVIASLATGGVYDRDIRRAGAGATPDAFGQLGQRKPALCLGDGGAVRSAFGGQVVGEMVHVIAIAAPTDAGREAIRELLDRARWLLDRWQHPETGAMGFFSGRLGRQEDEFGVWDRLLIRIAGIPATQWRERA